MQAIVKTPHIEVNIKGVIPQKLISLLKEEYGEEVKVIDNDDDKLANVNVDGWNIVNGDILILSGEFGPVPDGNDKDQRE